MNYIKSSTLLASMLVLLLAGLGCREVKPVPPIPVNTTTTTSTPSVEYTTTSTGFVYQNEALRYALKIPPHIAFKAEDGQMRLQHAIGDVPHDSPCNQKETQILKTITDFDVKIDVLEKNLKSAVTGNESPEFVRDHVEGNTLKSTSGSPDFIKEVQYGSLKGYEFKFGVEGCGIDTYYFPLSVDRTLRVERQWVGEFGFAGGDKREEYFAIPGVIRPAEADKLFNDILTSFSTSIFSGSSMVQQTTKKDVNEYSSSDQKVSFVYPKNWWLTYFDRTAVGISPLTPDQSDYGISVTGASADAVYSEHYGYEDTGKEKKIINEHWWTVYLLDGLKTGEWASYANRRMILGFYNPNDTWGYMVTAQYEKNDEKKYKDVFNQILESFRPL